MPKPIMSMNVVINITKEGEIPSLLCKLSFGSVLSSMVILSVKRKLRYSPLNIAKKQFTADKRHLQKNRLFFL